MQNSYSPSSERGNSVTDQRNRFVFSWIYEPSALNGGQGWIGKLSKGWKNSGVVTAGSGRPANTTVIGDANQDDNSSNDRLPGARRNSFTGPNYSSADMRLSRKLYAKHGWRLDFTAESFNLLNRLNRRFQITDEGLMSNAAAHSNSALNILESTTSQLTTRCRQSSCGPTSAYAPRQLQFALRLGF